MERGGKRGKGESGGKWRPRKVEKGGEKCKRRIGGGEIRKRRRTVGRGRGEKGF